MDLDPENWSQMFATNSKPPQNEVLKGWHLITLLKLSGPDGIQVHIKAIKIIMEKFQRRSQRSSSYPVHTTVYFPIVKSDFCE